MINAKGAANLTNLYTNRWSIDNIIECNARLGKFAAIIPDYKIPEDVNEYQLVYNLNKAGYKASFAYGKKNCDEYCIAVSWFDAAMEDIENA